MCWLWSVEQTKGWRNPTCVRFLRGTPVFIQGEGLDERLMAGNGNPWPAGMNLEECWLLLVVPLSDGQLYKEGYPEEPW